MFNVTRVETQVTVSNLVAIVYVNGSCPPDESHPHFTEDPVGPVHIPLGTEGIFGIFFCDLFSPGVLTGGPMR